MDTKLKSNNKGNIFGIILCIIIIGFLSSCAIASYPLVKKNARAYLEQREKNMDKIMKEVESSQKTKFVKILYKSNCVLAMQMDQQLLDLSQKLQEKMQGELITDIFIEDFEDERKFDELFNHIMSEWQNEFYDYTLEYYPDFQYYAINNKNGKAMTNSINDLNLLTQDTEEAQSFKDSLAFYIVFHYQENGDLTVADYKGLDQDLVDKYRLLELNKSEMQDYFGYYERSLWYRYKDEIRPPADMTIIYASVSKDFYKPGSISFYVPDMTSAISSSGLIYVFIACAGLIVLAAMLLPLKKSWNVGRGITSKIPFEINVAGLFVTVGLYNLISQVVWETMDGSFIVTLEPIVVPDSILKAIDYCISFFLWFITLSIIFMAFVSMRQVFSIGFRSYLTKKTAIGRIVVWIFRRIRQFIKSIGEVDLTDKSNKVIIKALIVNFSILLVLCGIWVFGIPLLIVYSIILFFVLRKYYDDVRRKYMLLLEGTRMIAEGNLDYKINEELGVFEPLKNELSKVQNGFKKAVEEEVKSQRMKADLITNVSHDLKTPLTAIITYVNLLKEEGTNEEERKAYINTLDKKSQRLKNLIDDLFEVSKATSHNVSLNIVDVDIIDLIKQLLLEMDDKIRESGITFRFNYPEEKLVLKLDSDKTYRVFENLLMNVIKYSMPNTRAYIDITRSEDEVMIAVKNISAAEINFNPEEITERFVRGDQSRSSEGSGLGLAIAKSFVELQGGKFVIEVDGDLFKAIVRWVVSD